MPINNEDMVIFSRLDWIQSQNRLVEWTKKSGHEIWDLSEIHRLPDRPETRAVLISPELDLLNLQSLRQNQRILALLPIRLNQVDQDIEKTITYIDKLESENASLVISNHSDGAESFRFQVHKSEERWALIEQLGDYAQSLPVFETFPDMVRTIASELLTNAFYNAPQDENGRPIQPNRGEGVSIVPPRFVDFSYGDDGTHLWIKVTDPFGTFSRNKLLDHLLGCASREQLVVKDGVGGAGIGLFMVFRWSTQLLFVFEPGRETFVFVKLLKTKRMRVFDSQRAIFEVIQRSA